MEAIRLIATDMDGTLLGHALDGIPPRNADALRRAQERGIALALATGRLPDDAGFFALDAGLHMHVLGLNGSVEQPEPLGEVTSASYIPPQAARRVRAMMEACGLDFCLFSLHDVAFNAMPADLTGAMRMCGTFLERSGGRTRCWPDGRQVESLLDRTSKFVVDGHKTPDRLLKLKELVEAEVPEVEVTSSWAGVIEIIPVGVNKGTALAALAERLGIPMAQVMAIGDNDNDVAMLRVAGCAVAMANATPAAKQAAHWIAPSNHENGVAAAVCALALGEKTSMALLKPGGAHC